MISSSPDDSLPQDLACLQGLYQDGTLAEILPEGKIRLLSIYSTTTCRLTEVPVEKAPPYVALSYYWGNANCLSPIDINGRQWYLRRHVYDMICKIFEVHKEALIWIDMLCINQSSQRDRELQVQQMGSIYRSAIKVYAWLGDELRQPGEERDDGSQTTEIIDDTDELVKVFEVLLDFNKERQKQPLSELDPRGLFETIYMGKMGQLPARHNQDDPTTFGEVLGLRPLYSRRYWQRLWPVQELILANEVVVCYRKVSINLDAMYDLSIASRSVGQQIEKGSFHAPVDGAVGWNTMCAIRDHRRIREDWTQGGFTMSQDFNIPLDELVQLFAKRNHCGKKKDKVYALRELTECWRDKLKPDYSETDLCTFQRVAERGLFKQVHWLTACHLWSAMQLGPFSEFKALAKEFMDLKEYEEIQEEIWVRIQEIDPKSIPEYPSDSSSTPEYLTNSHD